MERRKKVPTGRPKTTLPTVLNVNTPSDQWMFKTERVQNLRKLYAKDVK